MIRDWQKELDDYIRKVLALGFSRSEIEAALRSAGWEKDHIEAGMHRAMRIVKTSRLQPRQVKRSSSASQIRPPVRGLLSAHTPELLLMAPKKEQYMLPSASVYARARASIWRGIMMGVEKLFDVAEVVYGAVFRTILFPVALLSIIAKNAIRFTGKNLKAEKEVVATKKEVPVEEDSSSFPEHVLARDIIRLASRMFRARRLRTFLTILGMSVGIGTILFLVSFGYGIQNVLFERITTEEALLTLDAFPPSDTALISADRALVERIKGMPNVQSVSTLTLMSMEMSVRDFAAAGSLYTVDANYLKLAGARPLAGRILKEGEVNETVISSASLKLLNFQTPEEAIGGTVLFSVSFPLNTDTGESAAFTLAEPHTIVGVLDDPFSVFAYLPVSVLEGRAAPAFAQLKVRVKSSEFLDQIRDQILAEGLLVSALSETVSQAKKIFNIITIILGMFGIITLVVSAIGMLNTMTIALLERTQEVGIMKAVGASNFDIWKLFLAEAMIMGFLGGLGGIVMGFVTAGVFNYGINALAQAFGGQALDLFQSPVWFVLTIIMFSAAVGMVTGLWPARRASRLDPLDALKYR